MVPEIPKADKHRHQRRRKGTGTKHPQRGPAPADETQKTLVYFNTSIRGNEVMIGKLRTIFQDTDYLDTELVEDVIIELKQALNTVNIYSDILTGTMDAFASIISNNVNTIMKRMTSLSIVLMLPTLIASFYGMNVDIHLEEVPFAFSLIVLFSIGLSTLAFVIFRKIKWF